MLENQAVAGLGWVSDMSWEQDLGSSHIAQAQGQPESEGLLKCCFTLVLPLKPSVNTMEWVLPL